MFRVPEASRWTEAPAGLRSTAADGNNGAFRLPSSEPGWQFVIIASDEDGWEHVSVQVFRLHGTKRQMRTPTWREMCLVKDLFWGAEDEVVQFHPKRSEYVNCHPYVLHLWRPIGATIPTPPAWMVGPSPEAT